MKDIVIRNARPGDEAEIASVHTHGWQQSYRGIVADSVLNSRPLSFRRRMMWFRDIVEKKVPVTVFVAESVPHGIVAFCSVEAARDEKFKDYGEVAAIYCLNEYKGKGIGRALLQTGLQHLQGLGFAKVYLWVLKDNPTRKFYEKMGGRHFGKEKTVDLGGPLVEIAYEWRSQLHEK